MSANHKGVTKPALPRHDHRTLESVFLRLRDIRDLKAKVATMETRENSLKEQLARVQKQNALEREQYARVLEQHARELEMTQRLIASHD